MVHPLWPGWRRPAGRPVRRFRPEVQVLEDRLLMSVVQNYAGIAAPDEIDIGGGYSAPPDPGFAVGPQHVVELVNGAYAVYDAATGSPDGPIISSRSFWANAGLRGIDPYRMRVAYDPASDRWFAVGESDSSGGNTDLDLAVSTSPNPIATPGRWASFQIHTGHFVFDQPSLGLNTDGVFVSGRAQDTGDPSTQLYSFPKADLLAPTPTVANATVFRNLGYAAYGALAYPVVSDGGGPEAILGLNPADGQLILSTITGAGGPGAHLSPPTPLATGATTSGHAFHQPDGTQSAVTYNFFFGGGNALTSPGYQVGNLLYTVQTADAGNGYDGLHWAVTDLSSNTVVQQGDLRDPAGHFDYFAPSIAANANGDVVIALNRSGDATTDSPPYGPTDGNIGSYAFFGHTTAAGTLKFGHLKQLQAGTNPGDHNFFFDIWGGYTTVQVDPTDPSRFWTVAPYAILPSSFGNWGTQISELHVPSRGRRGLRALAVTGLAAASPHLAPADGALPGGGDRTPADPRANARATVASAGAESSASQPLAADVGSARVVNSDPSVNADAFWATEFEGLSLAF